MPSIVHKNAGRTTAVVVGFLPWFSGVFAALGGVTAIIGWLFGINRLIDWDLDGISIKFNAAICVTLAGISLLISVARPQWRIAIRAAAFGAAAIAAATLFQHLSGTDLGIDTLFVSEPADAPATTAPGRMGPPASLTLTLLGAALVLTTFKRSRVLASVLALFSLGVASLSLTGFLYGASQLYSIPRLTGIALQTGTIIALLSLGIVALIRERGLAAQIMKDDAGGTMFRTLLLPVVIAALMLGYLRVYLQNTGYVDTEFGTAARTLTEIVLFVALLWWTAGRLSAAEERSRDAEKVRAENETHRRIAIAQEAERRRIARDLHDHIGQQFTGLRLQLDSLCKTVSVDSPFGADLKNICDQTNKLDAELSLLVWQMRPGVLDTHGLVSALKSFVQEWSLNHGIRAEFHATIGDRRLSPEMETNLYRIIQESLNNILKHANAKSVNITLNYAGGDVVATIEDDGSGFDPEADRIHTTEGSGFGLLGMKERAVLIGGNLEVESTPGGGTAILVRVPGDDKA